MGGCEGKGTNCSNQWYQPENLNADVKIYTYTPTTFASNLCTICSKEIEKTITLKSGTLLKLCKEHLEEVEEQFAGKVIERHYYPSPQPFAPVQPTQPWVPWTNPVWTLVNPNTCANPQTAFNGMRTYC